MKKLVSLLLLMLFVSNTVTYANIIPKIELGNLIIEEEYPSSDMVEPFVPTANEGLTIEGSVEATPEIVESQNIFTLEDCLRIALGNNPRIQSSMQDVFASDTRIRQAWSDS